MSALILVTPYMKSETKGIQLFTHECIIHHLKKRKKLFVQMVFKNLNQVELLLTQYIFDIPGCPRILHLTMLKICGNILARKHNAFAQES